MFNNLRRENAKWKWKLKSKLGAKRPVSLISLQTAIISLSNILFYFSLYNYSDDQKTFEKFKHKVLLINFKNDIKFFFQRSPIL